MSTRPLAPVDLSDDDARRAWLTSVASSFVLLAATASDATSPARVYSRGELRRRSRRAVRSLRKLLVAAGADAAALTIPDPAPTVEPST